MAMRGDQIQRRHAPTAAGAPIVGRDEELARLHELSEQCAGGAGGAVVLLSGEAGIGKTRLAQELIAWASHEGWDARLGAAREHVGAPPYWPWIGALRGAVLERFEDYLSATETDYAQLVLQTLTGKAAARDRSRSELGPEEASFLLSDRLATFLRAEARIRPCLIVLEDMHWADQPSLRLLESVANGLDEAPLLILVTFRDDELSRDNPLTETLGLLAVQPRSERFRLPRLTTAAVRQLLAYASGEVPPAELVDAVHQRTAGNPFFAQEVVSLFLEHGKTAASVETLFATIPDTVRGAIARRLNRLSDRCIELLGLVAVLGPEYDLLTVQTINPSEDEIDEPMSEAFDAGILTETSGETRGYRFSHPLVREELYEGLGAARRQRLHRLVGESLEAMRGADSPSHLSELAYHFREAAPVGGAAKAVEYLFRSGQRSASQFAWSAAIRDFDSALALHVKTAGSEPETRVRLELALGLARAEAGDEIAATALLRDATDEALALGVASLAATAANAYALWASVASGGSDAPEIVPRLERALGLLGGDDRAARGRLLGQLATCSLYLPSASPQAAQTVALSNEAVSLARETDDDLALPEALTHAFRAHWPPELIDRRTEFADELVSVAGARDDVPHMLRGHVYATNVLLERGELSLAEQRGEQVRMLAERYGSGRYRAYSHLHRAWLSMLRGDFSDAEAQARAAIAEGVPMTDAFGMAALAGVWLAQGRLDQCRQELRPDFFACRSASVVWALVKRALGDDSEALSAYEALASTEFDTIERDADRAPGLAGLAELCVSFGDTSRAPTLYRLLEPSRDQFGVAHTGVFGSLARHLGLLAALTGQVDQAAADFEHALVRNAQSGARPWLACTQAEYAALLISRNESADMPRARSLLEEASSTANTLGMTPLAERCRELQSALSSASQTPDGLTPREVEVLGLIASGLSNAAVAEELVLSVRTVERHVTNLYGKIGARGRADATTYAIGHRLIATP